MSEVCEPTQLLGDEEEGGDEEMTQPPSPFSDVEITFEKPAPAAPAAPVAPASPAPSTSPSPTSPTQKGIVTRSTSKASAPPSNPSAQQVAAAPPGLLFGGGSLVECNCH